MGLCNGLVSVEREVSIGPYNSAFCIDRDIKGVIFGILHVALILL